MQERSPLDDYFRDVDAQLEMPGSRGTTSAVEASLAWQTTLDTDWGDDNLINPPSPPSKGWTGTRDCVPGPSSKPNVPPAATAPETVAFAEQFKYQVCSSGLLEKDFAALADEGRLVVDQKAGTDGQVHRILRRAVRVARVEWRLWMRKGLERWDIVVAGIILLGAMIVLMGWLKVLVWMLCLGLGIGSAEIWQQWDLPVNGNVLLASSPRLLALESLQHLIITCASLDASLTSSLLRLPTLYGNHLQSSLHQLCTEITDHIATASSSLQCLVDTNEMRMLREMYDIPIENGARARLSGLTDSSGGKDEVHGHYESRHRTALGAVPSPRRDRFDSPPSTIRPLRTLPNVTSPRLTSSHQRHARHLSLIPTGHYADHFTSVPQRTPRLAKRSSWDIGAGRRFSRGEETGLMPAWRLAEPLKRARSSRTLIHQKRITEADEDGELGGSSQSGEESNPMASSEDDTKPTLPPNGLRILSLPTSPISPQSQHTPKHTSPLSNHPHTSAGASLTESAIRLASLSHHAPSPPYRELNLNISPPTGNPKRRSLGNMPYCHPPSSPLFSYGSQGMSRSRSLQSDLQDARARSATGSRSRRTSMSASVSSVDHSIQHSPLHPAPNHARRVSSVSPLTAPALQATCLGVHLKRRTVACALLALRWSESAGYWSEVKEVLDTLRDGIQREVDKLRDVREEQTAVVERTERSRPPWARVTDETATSFAPVSSVEAEMREHVRVVQGALEEAWAKSVTIGRQLDSQEVGLEESWAGLRAELGTMVREAERGRDTLRKMAITAEGQPNPTFDPIDIHPAFLQTWNDDTLPQRSTSIGTTTISDISSPNPQAEEDDAIMLAPPGAEEVYEAETRLLTREDTGLGKMGRDERVSLMKLAREKGLTLGEYMRVGLEYPSKVDDGGRGEGEKVVEELRGVIGLIRERKSDMAAGLRTGAAASEMPTMTLSSTTAIPNPRADAQAYPIIPTSIDPSLTPFSRFLRSSCESPSTPPDTSYLVHDAQSKRAMVAELLRTLPSADEER